jgi:hypothetical protein
MKFLPLLLLVIFGCTHYIAPTAKPATSLAEENFPIIDAHTHTRFTGKTNPYSGITSTLTDYQNALKEANVVGAVVHTSQTGQGYVDLKSQHIIHCGGVDAKVDVKRLEDGLKAGRYSCIKIYLGYVYQYANDPGYEPAYKLAKKYNVPVVFHTGDTYSTDGKLKYSDPMAIDEVAVDHRDVTFVIAHCGNPWIETAAEIAYKNANVYLDGSALLVGKLENYTDEQLETLVAKPIRWIFAYVDNPNKLMFGSDWPLVSIKRYKDAFAKGIPPEYRRKVFYENAMHVFKIPGLPEK